MARQLMLWVQNVQECQKSVTDLESAMGRAKAKYLEKKNAFEGAKKQLTEAIIATFDDETE